MCSYGAIYISNSEGVHGSNCCNGPGVTVVTPVGLRAHMALMATIHLKAPMAHMRLHFATFGPMGTSTANGFHCSNGLY